METFEKILIGLLLFVITSIVAYLFRIRQLYVVAPKLYTHSQITTNGLLCEIVVYNKGNQVEEDIQIELDRSLKWELLASNTSEITFDKSTMKIERLHKGCEETVLLLVENGLFDSTKIKSISSKAAKGKIYKKISDIHPNYAKTTILILCAIGIFPTLKYGKQASRYVTEQYVEYKLGTIKALGWNSLAEYYFSDIRQNYGDQEFPVRYIDQAVDGNKVKLKYEIYNKTATPLQIALNNQWAGKQIRVIAPNYYELNGYEVRANVPPMSKEYLIWAVPLPEVDSARFEIGFSFSAGFKQAGGGVHSVEYKSKRTESQKVR